jgi:hypothetical protein
MLARLRGTAQHTTLLLGGTRALPDLSVPTLRLDPTRDLAALLEGTP